MKKCSFLLIVVIFTLFLLSSCSIKNVSQDEYLELLYKYHVLEEKENACIDLRDLHSSYSAGHIKGFVNYNYNNGSKEEFLIYVSSMYSKDVYIFLIDEDGSIINEAAQVLKNAGYKHIIVYEEGYKKLEEKAKESFHIIEGIDDCGC